MSKIIYKYPLAAGVSDAVMHVIIAMPVGAEILTVQLQNGVPTIWALVDPAADLIKRMIRRVGTGVELGDDYFGSPTYIGTVQEDVFVWHYFDAGEIMPTETNQD